MIALRYDPGPAGMNRVQRVRATDDGGHDLHSAEFDPHDPAGVNAFAEAVERIFGAPGTADAIREKIGERVAADVKIINAGNVTEQDAQLRPVVIDGMLRETETMNIVSASKGLKSHTLLQLAICITLGRPWLDTFSVAQGRVLYVDRELHPQTFWYRFNRIVAAMGVMRDQVMPYFDAIHLRGRNTDINRIGSTFKRVPKGEYKIIILDPIYKLLPPDCDENSNSDMSHVWTTVDGYTEMTGSAFCVIHHSTKGNQSEKSTTDIGAGAGAQSRAADSHIILRAHEVEDAVVLDGAVRSFPPINPLCVRWEYPLWRLAPDLSPDDLRKPGGRRRRPKAEGTPEPKAEPWTPLRFVTAFITAEPATEAKIITAASLDDLSERQAKRLLAVAVEDGIAYRWTDANPAKPDRFASVEQTLISDPPTKKRGRTK